MRRAARTDRNHAELVQLFRQLGCEVQSLAAIGKGVPDLLIYQRSTKRLLLIEVKDGKASPSARKLRPEQEAWHARWPVTVVDSVEAAIAALA